MKKKGNHKSLFLNVVPKFYINLLFIYFSRLYVDVL
jgi:hypothetical protein